VIDINLKGTFNYTKAALKPMMKQRFGRIVNVSSIVGVRGNAGQGNYSASKGGVIAFTKSCSKEFGSRNITVNAIAPGFIATKMTGFLKDEQKAKLMSTIPLKKLGSPKDVANACLFLVSDRASYITGHVLNVDGGIII
ncbi:SDR family oxidoreductase, partial [bacterium]